MKQGDFTILGREMKNWYGGLRGLDLADLTNPKRIVVFSADMINGFCKTGNLASPRVDAISKPVADLFLKMHGVGVERFVLLQEWHDENADEFSTYPPHGVAGTEEAEVIPELLGLPFSDKFTVFRKNSLSPAFARNDRCEAIFSRGNSDPYPWLGLKFEDYLDTNNPSVAIVVGNCTDLCVRELAMYLKMWSNQHQKGMRVIIPENCVETFDLPFDAAADLGVQPHPGDIYHVWALHEMARNGIDIVKEIS